VNNGYGLKVAGSGSDVF